MNQFGCLEAVLWDMDGVLLDSKYAHFITFQRVFGKYGWEVNEETFQRIFGMTNEQVIRQVTHAAIAPSVIKEISLEKDECFREVIAAQAVFMDGVQLWLTTFKNNGIQQALASSGSMENINTILGALHAYPYFDAIVSGEDCASKPDPAVFLRAAEKLGAAPAGCLVIEDSVAGIQAAAAAGMKCLAVATTYPAAQLPQTDLILTDLTVLDESMLEKIFRV